VIALPRVYPILDTAALEIRRFDALSAAETILECGAKILQFRHKSFWSREIFAEAGEIARLCGEAGAIFVVNDRADYASFLGVALHLGQDDLLPEDARRVVGAEAIVGFSTHNEAQMRAAESEPVDYVAFGPVFSTVSKDRPDPVVGIEGLAAVRALTTRPLVAIGGIQRDNARPCWAAGADSVAIIADLLPSSLSKSSLRARMTEWLQIGMG
jgi:thiamine-phosphate pyrophosphorylase